MADELDENTSTFSSEVDASPSDDGQTAEATESVAKVAAPASQTKTLAELVAATAKKSASLAEPDVEPKTEVEEPKAEAQEEPQKQAETEQKPEKEEEQKPIPYSRFHEVNEAKKQAELALEEVKPLAEAHKSIVSFCQQHQISQEDFGFWLNVAAVSKNDPGRALQLLQPQLQSWQTTTGEVLPNDIQKLVDEGKVDLEVAKRLAAAEGQKKLQVEQAQRQQQATLAQQEQLWMSSAQRELGAWADNRRKTDTEFVPKARPELPDGKYELFLNKFANAARTAKATGINNIQDYIQQLVSIADQCYSEVEASLKRFQPRANGVRTVRSTQSTVVAPKAPTNVREAINQRLAARGYAS